MLIDGKLVPLGKRPVRHDPRGRTLRLSDYIGKITLAQTPQEVSWIVKVPHWPMYLNDQLGDCVVAAMGHMVDQWTYYSTGSETLLTNAQILKGYEDIGGYVPGNPNTDNGCDMLTALKYWKSHGLAGHKIQAYMAINPKNIEEVKLSVELFGNVFLGVQLPLSAQGENDWTVPLGGIYSSDGQPGGWGGHCIPVMAASPLTRSCITWGSLLKMSANFFADYADEAYAVLSPEWITKRGLSPSEFNMAALQADLNAIAAL